MAAASRPSATSPRRRLSPDQRRVELLDAAAAIVMRDGDLTAASLERVAEEAGCSRNLVYRYFGNHDGLIDALWEHQRREVVASIATIDPTAPIRVWAHEVVAALLVAAQGRGPLLVMLFDRRRGLGDRAERQFLVAALVARLRLAGVSEPRSEVLAPLLGSVVIGAVVAKVLTGAPDPRILDEVDLVLDALLPTEQ